MKEVYFDNAATSLYKPPSVVAAVTKGLKTFGGPGRGTYAAANSAAFAMYEARENIAQLFNVEKASHVAFSMNATHALNIAINSLLPKGGKALTTQASHNSVLRPLFRARDKDNAQIFISTINPDASLDWNMYEQCLELKPDLVVLTHASNVTGDVYDVKKMTELAHEIGANVILDAAQSAGQIPIDMRDLGVDVLCFTGHKSLMGPQGTGGLCVANDVVLTPLLEGGSGVLSFEERHPTHMPDALEAGTQNAHGIAGLSAGVHYLLEIGVEKVEQKLSILTSRLEEGLKQIEGVTIRGGHGGINRTAVVAITVGNVDSAQVSFILDQNFSVSTRPGAHCAPLMHNALGTTEQGVVRLSLSSFNSQEEVDYVIDAVAQTVDMVQEM